MSTVEVEASEPIYVPLGSEVISTSPLEVKLAEYNYTQFEDPNAPAFFFKADKVYPDGTIERNVECVSLPGRTTVERT